MLTLNDLPRISYRREEKKREELKIGELVDLKSILSSRGGDRDYLVPSKGGQGAIVPISNLYGKYVLVCLFTTPSEIICQSLEALYSELSLQFSLHLVEFVLLLDYDFPSCPPPFYDFFKSLSFNCLTIPSSDYTTNSCPPIFDSLPHSGVSCLAIDPSGLVLQNSYHFLYRYGAASFPFHKDHFEKIHRHDLSIISRLSTTPPPITLDQLLHCHSLPQLVDPNNFINMSSLRNKPVGLYLYSTGRHLVTFLNMHQQCLNKGLDFQFILVPIPYDSLLNLNPVSFFQHMKESVLASCPTSSWLTFPFNDKICRTIWRLHNCFSVDRLIIMPHDGRPGDLAGSFILRMYGIKSYPFTTDAIVQNKITRLRSTTLESLLGDVPMLDIRNKNVILYIVDPYSAVDYNDSYSVMKREDYNYSYSVMKREFPNIQKLFPDSLLYTIPLMCDSPDLLETLGFKVLPQGKWKSVMDYIFMSNDPLWAEPIGDTVVAFGKDGKVVSRFTQDRMCYLTAASIFDDQLYYQLSAEIQREIDTEY